MTDTPVVISVQNLSSVLTDAKAEQIVAALNEQATQDYNKSPWVTQGLAVAVDCVRFVPKGEVVPSGTWHLELLDTSDQPGALGYHEDGVFDKAGAPTGPKKSSDRTSRGFRADAPELPLMKISVKTSEEDGVAPSEVASHEMLEALVDPQVVREVRTVKVDAEQRIYIVEVGDPVQNSGKNASNGELLANFAWPAYFHLAQTDNPTQYDQNGVLTSPVPAMTRGAYLSYAPESEPENWKQIQGEKINPESENDSKDAEEAAATDTPSAIFVIIARGVGGVAICFGPTAGHGFASRSEAAAAEPEVTSDPRLGGGTDITTEIIEITAGQLAEWTVEGVPTL